ncbi:Myc-type, basic helix-loop-helix (bHLH) domain [Dillenia turbinata]|uniref:Myc-type, basic helix-loop-helix (BHLH) domain n=1 Tax=Dillenia turbinata TaxID=194707 RepID=A0AAN8VE55_9MAGN
MDNTLCEFFGDSDFCESKLDVVDSPEDLSSFFEALEGLPDLIPCTPLEEKNVFGSKEVGDETNVGLFSQKPTCSSASLQQQESETDVEAAPKSKKRKLASSGVNEEEANAGDGQHKMSHITVERNRRKQMNEHLSVLRALMPCFYVKRGDQASIIAGVVEYINELQQVLQSLEAKKQRKAYSEVLSPRLVSSSPRPLPPLSPRKPPPSPRLISVPLSPRTPTPSSPYKPKLQQGYLSPTMASSLEPSPTSSSSSSILDNIHELVANSKSAIADVEVKFSGPNVLLKTTSARIPGQAMKIIAALEDLSLEILHVKVSTVDETMLNSFTIKIGIECQLSAEELAHLIQQTFC